MTSNAPRVLYVEDDDTIAIMVVARLQENGFVVTRCSTYAAAFQHPLTTFDVALLDWSLPDGQGLDLLKAWRAMGASTPILFCSARTDVVDIVTALECGSNDYVQKPFHMSELMARLRLQVRLHGAAGARLQQGGAQEISSTTQGNVTQEPEPSLLEGHGLQLDLDSRKAMFEGREIDLTRMEFLLARFFLEHPGKVFSREEILDRVWGENNYGTNRTIDTHVLQLRKKTRSDFVETVWGFGYRLPPVGTPAPSRKGTPPGVVITLLLPLLWNPSRVWATPQAQETWFPPAIIGRNDPRVTRAHELVLRGDRPGATSVVADALRDRALSPSARTNLRALLGLLARNDALPMRKFPDAFVRINDVDCQPVGARATDGVQASPLLQCGAAGPWRVASIPGTGGLRTHDVRLTHLPTATHVTLSPPESLVKRLGAYEPGSTLHFRIEDLGRDGRRLSGVLLRFSSLSRFDAGGRKEQGLVAFRLDGPNACAWAEIDALRDTEGYKALLDVLDTFAPSKGCETTWVVDG